MQYVSLLPQEIAEIERVLDSVVPLGSTVEREAFLLEAQVIAHELPKRIRQAFCQLKLTESHEGIIVKKSPLALDHVGPTPRSPRSIGAHLGREEVLHVLYASLLGGVVAWSSPLKDTIIDEIVPIKGHEERPMSSGSTVLLDLHTDYAFHRYANDYIGWLCIRNPDRIPTTVAPLKDITLPPDVKRMLFEPRFRVANSRERVPIFFGHPDAPYIRLNTSMSGDVENDRQASLALEVLSVALRAKLIEIALEPGDFFYLDNYRAVHGRKPYQPRYDGNDRWLKRVSITSCFRRSRALRYQPQSRIIERDF